MSGAVASIVMMIWDSKVTEKMYANEIGLLMYGRYVDDGNYLIRVFGRGWRWSDEHDRMIYRSEYARKDDEKNEEDDVRVMREVRKLANSIWDWIECTEEVGSVFEDGNLPILDLKVYCVKVRLSLGVDYWEPRWSFYEKSMKSKYVIMERSAMSDKVKATP